MKPGDMVEILPEFLEDDDSCNTGIILRESDWEEGYQTSMEPHEHEKWWVVLLGEKITHCPRDVFRLMK